MSGNSRATRSWAVLAAAPVSMGSGAGGGVVVVFLAGFGGGIFNMSKLGKFPETSIDDTHNEIINKANVCAIALLSSYLKC